AMIEIMQLMQQIKDRVLAATRANIPLIVIAKYQAAHAVAVTQRRPAEQGTNMRRQNRFKTAMAAKKHRRTLVGHHKYRSLAFLAEYFCVRNLRARRDPPIDSADIVAGLIEPY